MFLVPLVLFCKNFFEPMCLFGGEPFVGKRRMVIDKELLAATVTPERSHFPEALCPFLALTLLYCGRLYQLILLRVLLPSTDGCTGRLFQSHTIFLSVKC
jgi:hypothetical protein